MLQYMILRNPDAESLLHDFRQLSGVVIFCLFGTAVSLYLRRLWEGQQRCMSEDSRPCIESRIKMECEKEQQETLLLSVIPAYIAVEVSALSMRKHGGICILRTGNADFVQGEAERHVENEGSHAGEHGSQATVLRHVRPEAQ